MKIWWTVQLQTQQQGTAVLDQMFRHFISKKVECLLCNNMYAYHGGTSNLRDHFQRSHSQEFCKPTKQPTMDTFMHRSTCPSSCSTEITSLMVNMIFRELQPVAIVKGNGFRELFRFVEPGYKVPSATHIAQEIRNSQGKSQVEATKH
jgi:hypothetical protein